MAAESSDEWRSKVPSNGRRKFRWTAPVSFDEWRPKVLMNGGQKFQQMAAESSDERRPKVPMNGRRKFHRMATESSNEWRPKVPTCRFDSDNGNDREQTIIRFDDVDPRLMWWSDTDDWNDHWSEMKYSTWWSLYINQSSIGCENTKTLNS